jgi:putative holliday junction resolvase
VDSTSRPDDRVLAVDFGTRRIGLAIGNTRDRIAVRLMTLDLAQARSADLVKAVADVAQDEEVTRLIVGLPLNMDGSAGPAARAAQGFGTKLSALTGLPVEYVDERLSSEAAQEAARNASGGKRVRKPIDDLAAAILLQGWFDEEAAKRARRSWEES